MTHAPTPYDAKFFRRNAVTTLSSAQLIVPYLVELANPRSVIDVGCGDGTWLSVFSANGVIDIFGVDGDYVAAESLRIPRTCFEARDLKRDHGVARTWDLALSLEVAEHLPPEVAGNFVHFLCRLAPVVVFSAAIPGQAGVNHINEQWQSYWVEQFAAQDFVPIDCIRPRFWTEPEVAIWYAQNTILYVRREWLVQESRLANLLRQAPRLVDVVHPRLFSRAMERASKASSAAGGSLLRRFIKRLLNA